MDSLFQSPPIVENILKHLNARDLLSCGKVCKLWKSMSAVELKQRPKIDYFFETAESEHTSTLEHEGVECAFEEEIRKQLVNLRIKPSFCIAFASKALLADCEHLFPSLFTLEPTKKKQKSYNWAYIPVGKRNSAAAVLKQVVNVHLPTYSNYVFAVAPGIVGCSSYNTSVEVEDGCTITGFCLPKIPGVEFHFYDILKCNLEEIISKEEEGKGMLIFSDCANSSHSVLNTILGKCVKKNPNLAVGGAVVTYSTGKESRGVEHNDLSRNFYEPRPGKVLVISGENVEVASLIIKKSDDKKELKKKLKLFEETGLLKNQCFAFMFACVARGYYIYNEHNYESSVFHSLYPKVPLIGLFGEGEIGVNYLPNVEPTEKISTQKKYFYSYSTVFVLVSIKE